VRGAADSDEQGARHRVDRCQLASAGADASGGLNPTPKTLRPEPNTLNLKP